MIKVSSGWNDATADDNDNDDDNDNGYKWITDVSFTLSVVK